MNAIIGRKEEIKILERLCESDEAQFLAVYGRRRVGKTFLISEYFKDRGDVYFEITGMKGGSLKEQLFLFHYEYLRQFGGDKKIPVPANWGEAFTLLNETIENIAKSERVILFFDEVPWLASKKSGFLKFLEHFWNRYLSRNPNVILIVCGSSASWVIKNILNNKGGLHGRVTRRMRLLPFTLSETEEFLKSRHIELDRKQLIDIYMAIGGIPKYLQYIQRGKSATQNINDICFTVKGGLYDEFDNLYSSLFDDYQHHAAIVRALTKHTGGLVKNELLKITKMSSGGSSSKVIRELVDAGFIIYVPPFGKKSTGGVYRLIDEYSLFYLTWIDGSTGISLESVDPEYWIKMHGTHKWYSWSGCAFESVCLKHIQNIKKGLEILGISSIESGWQSVTGGEGAQIDLVIDRADRCINLCEIKYSDSEFEIDKSYAFKLQNKKEFFRKSTKTKKSLFNTLITTYGVKKNAYSLSVVNNQLTMNDLFNF